MSEPEENTLMYSKANNCEVDIGQLYSIIKYNQGLGEVECLDQKITAYMDDY